jgi:hypothetical protein
MHLLNNSVYQSIDIDQESSEGILNIHGDRIRIRIPAPKEVVKPKKDVGLSKTTGFRFPHWVRHPHSWGIAHSA